MTPLKCDLCGSQDIVKDGDYFVCQHCGTKYTLETAKQMMLGGTVKVDNNDQVQNYIILAQRAMEAGEDNQTILQYIQKALELAPNNEEVLSLEKQVLSSTCLAKAKKLGRNFGNGYLDKVDRKEIETFLNRLPSGEKSIFLEQLTKALIDGVEDGLASETFDEFDKAKTFIDKDLPYWQELGVQSRDTNEIKETIANHYFNGLQRKEPNFKYNFSGADGDNYYLGLRTRDEICSKLTTIAEWTTNDSLKVAAYNLLIQYVAKYPKNKDVSSTIKRENEAIIKETKEKIAKLNIPTTSIPEQTSTPESTKTAKGGCFVATAIYGSYDCPEVWILRRFRDYDLAETWYGRVFIRTYYAISPTIVKWFGKSQWFNDMWKPVLDKMVRSLKAKGYEDTPYNDRNW